MCFFHLYNQWINQPKVSQDRDRICICIYINLMSQGKSQLLRTQFETSWGLKDAWTSLFCCCQSDVGVKGVAGTRQFNPPNGAKWKMTTWKSFSPSRNWTAVMFFGDQPPPPGSRTSVRHSFHHRKILPVVGWRWPPVYCVWQLATAGGRHLRVFVCMCVCIHALQSNSSG